MMTNQQTSCKRQMDRGVSLLIIAVSMIFVLGMAGLAIDLASLYVGRSQAQRSADAAALAAAHVLADPANACMSGVPGQTLSANCVALAKQQAEAVGDMNLVAGVNPNIQDADIEFIDSSSSNPRIRVTVARDTARGDPMPTFFVKIFGIDSANVSAQAMSEAYTSTGTGATTGAQCVKPWLVPNCDQVWTPTDPSLVNNNCKPATGEFVIPNADGISSTLARSGQAPNGPIGEPFTLKPGSPSDGAAPGQYYAAFIPNTTDAPTECPSCAGATPINGGVGSAAIYREDIECCNQNPITCGSDNVTLASSAGNMVGPTQQGVDCLIHQSGSSWPNNCGQDRMNGTTNPCTNAPPPIMTSPFDIKAGPNNPYKAEGQPVGGSSDSVVSLPIWDGTPLTSGQNYNLRIVGFLQLFIQSEGNPQGTVYGTIMGVSGCGDGGSGSGSPGGGSGAVLGTPGSPIVVRLIHE